MNSTFFVVQRAVGAVIAATSLMLLAGCNGDDKQREDVAAIRKILEEEQATKASEAEADKARLAAMKAKASESARKAGIKQ